MCTFLVAMSNIYNFKKWKETEKKEKTNIYKKRNAKMAESNRRLHEGPVRLFNLAHPLLLNSNHSDHIRNVFV